MKNKNILLWSARIVSLSMILLIILAGILTYGYAGDSGKVRTSKVVENNFVKGAEVLSAQTLANKILETNNQSLSILPGETIDSYISEAKKMEIGFWMAGAKINAYLPDVKMMKLTVRFSQDGNNWTGWKEMELEESGMADKIWFADPISLENNYQYLQYSVVLTSTDEKIKPELYEIIWITMDPTDRLASWKNGWDWMIESVNGKEKVDVISRKEWGADESIMKWNDLEYAPVKQIIVHHTAGGDNSPLDPAAVVRGIYYFHAVEKDWGDIGYNYLVDQNGNIYEGRKGGLGVVAAHSTSNNYGSTGIALIGNYIKDAPTGNMMSGLIDLMSYVAYQADIDLTQEHSFNGKNIPVVAGHRDVNSTECPGDVLYSMLPDLAVAAKNGLDGLPEKTYEAIYTGQSANKVSLQTGQMQNLVIRFKNTGTAMWLKERGDVSLVPIEPFPRNSGFATSNWVSYQEVGGLSQITVMSQEEGWFNLELKGLSQDGNFTEKYALKGPGGIMEGTSFEVKIENKKVDIVTDNSIKKEEKKTEEIEIKQPEKIKQEVKKVNQDKKVEANLYHAQWVAQADNIVLFPGQEKSVWVDIKNTGKTPWYKDGDYPVRLGTDNPLDRNSGFSAGKGSGWLAGNRIELSQWSVEPGEVGRFKFTIFGNEKPGIYKEYFRPVVENVTWMEDMGIFIQVEIASPTYRAEWIGQSESPLTLESGRTARLWVELKNSGNTAWRNDGDNPVRLGTDQKLDRESDFYTPGFWVSQNRAGNMKKNAVEPGDTVRFEILVTAPDKAGVYKEYFRPVVENIGWLDDLGIYWEIEVK